MPYRETVFVTSQAYRTIQLEQIPQYIARAQYIRPYCRPSQRAIKDFWINCVLKSLIVCFETFQCFSYNYFDRTSLVLVATVCFQKIKNIIDSATLIVAYMCIPIHRQIQPSCVKCCFRGLANVLSLFQIVINQQRTAYYSVLILGTESVYRLINILKL